MSSLKKAVLTGCLFLLCLPSNASISFAGPDPQWTFDEKSQQAYELVLQLQTEEAFKLLPSPTTAQELYVTSLAEALELLITEDGEKYTAYEENFNRRLDRKTKPTVADDLFLQAEIRLHWTFIYLKFGHEFDAALNLRQAYLTLEEIRKRFPKYEAINKSRGLLNVILGSVPQKYNWVLSLLNMEGSTEEGMKLLREATSAGNPLAFEASLTEALIEGLLLQEPSEGLSKVKTLLSKQPDQPLALLIGSGLAIKSAESETALQMLNTLESARVGIPLAFMYSMKGEVYLHKAEYLNSITAYRWFINQYRGQNGVKDAHYKIGLCYWLNGNKNDAYAAFELAKSAGKEASEADRYAARSLADKQLPHIQLTKARYAMDGGYYSIAREILSSIDSADLKTDRDRVEFPYRYARLEHQEDNFNDAIRLYDETIRINGNGNWYFAPNACLQLGYIYLHQGKTAEAKTAFTRALTYNKHEYKNSIDSKAKSALAQIKRK